MEKKSLKCIFGIAPFEDETVRTAIVKNHQFVQRCIDMGKVHLDIEARVKLIRKRNSEEVPRQHLRGESNGRIKKI